MFWSVFVGKKVLVQSCLGLCETCATQSGFQHLSPLTDTQEKISGQKPQYKCYNMYPNSFTAERLVFVFIVHKICIDNYLSYINDSHI